MIELRSSRGSSGESVKVVITFKRQVQYGEQESVSLYNMLFRRTFSALRMCQMNRNFYEPELAMAVPQHK